jgi:hypothetical protein
MQAQTPGLLWARLKTHVPGALRRGAWYRVIRRTEAAAILEVDQRPSTILCEHLEFTDIRPDRWTIVDQPGVATEPAAACDPAYGVCPSCSSQATIVWPIVEVPCETCGGTFLVDWRAAWSGGRDGMH